MFTQDFRKLRLAIGSILTASVLYVMANVSLLGIASSVEAGGKVYPYNQQDWLRYPATGRQVSFKITILFPWDSERELFTGERIYIETDEDLLPPDVAAVLAPYRRGELRTGEGWA